MEEILAMEHITKTYPGVKALDDVSISFIQGEVHAVMGENGAGKSTLMKILNGMIPADSGDIRFHGEKVAIRNPRDARALGIAMIHQELNPIKDLTVAENMFVGRYPQKGCFVDWSTMYDECRKLFEHWKVDFDPIFMMIFFCLLLSQCMTQLKIPQMLVDIFLGFTNNKFVVLIMVNVFLLFVGMIVNDTTAIMLCAPLLMPLLTAYGVNPIHFGALMIVNLSCGCLTPPYASVLYFGMKVGNAKFGEMMKNTLVFLLVGYVPVMLLTTYVEAISLFLPRLLGYA